MSGSPTPKRQRFTQPATNAAGVATVASSFQTGSAVHDNFMSGLEKEEPAEVTPNAREQIDEKIDATAGRKVPPLRISLPRTPSEDGATVVNATDDTASAAANAGRRTTRGAKGHSKKNQSPDESASKICDESIQRVTRLALANTCLNIRKPEK
ncbi:unnamed protein product [Gongylonema pulchrum]|uniref:Uncharacterized protein n=1 Tax=Gongylonema pulchrum TaxID=637853 RepID=A0A183E508_9BILA|nr:unnamed protein product [Gongylonema pulchrum]